MGSTTLRDVCIVLRRCPRTREKLIADRSKKLLLLLAGGAQGAWRHCFAGYGERVGGAFAGGAEPEAPYGAGGL